MRKRAGGRLLGAVLAASMAVVPGCAGPVDVGKLPGVYRDDETGGEVRLESDGAFSATGVLLGKTSEPVDFSGRWELHDSQTSSDFVYLSVEDGGLGRTGGVQLCTRGEGTVYFRFDPDGPPTLELDKVGAP
ncbi:hypothetical protein [Streptomyces sp. NPDC057496]|uniref:hypothetical protein n=1 Tax=Streptomyces sp. NPDC057496 TaxID=3346149 RepID=UPI0036B7E2D9